MPPHRRRGFALVIVLWAVGVLALIVAMLIGNARSEAVLTTTLRDQAVGRAAADGVLSSVIVEILLGGRPPAGTRRFSGLTLDVAAEDLSGRMNPNIVPASFMQALLVRVGVAPQRAEALAAAIVDWRTPGLAATAHGAKDAEYRAAGRGYGPPGKPFETLDEIGLVLGMDAATLAALKPHLTLWSTGTPDPAVADATVLAALRAAGVPLFASPGTEPRVIELVATAHLPAGASVRRRAVVRFGYSPDGRGWRVLQWDDGVTGDAASEAAKGAFSGAISEATIGQSVNNRQ